MQDYNITLISLGALLHDIGKFYMRANRDEKIDYKNYKLKHAAFTNKVFDIFNEYFTKFGISKQSFVYDSAYHHINLEELENNSEFWKIIYTFSDWLSAAERLDEEDDDLEKLKYFEKPLYSIFEPEKGVYGYNLSKLSCKKDVLFPKKEISNLNYKELWEQFEEDLNKSLDRLIKNLNISDEDELNNIKLNHLFNLIFTKLYQYTWCIPADTYSKKSREKHYSIISLFDHSKITSAFAGAFYYNYIKYKDNDLSQINWKNFFENSEFTILKVDFGGIQKFISAVKTGEGDIAKRLRGRSFLMAILPEIMARYIINQYGLIISNIVFCGGGGFDLLLPKDDEKLNEILNKLEKYTLEVFEGEISLGFGKVNFKAEDILKNRKSYSDIYGELSKDLNNKKYKKYANFLTNLEIINKNAGDKIGLCKACGIYLVDKENGICKLCHDVKEIGEWLPKTKFIGYSKLDIKNDDLLKIDLDELGYLYFFKDTKELKENIILDNFISVIDIQPEKKVDSLIATEIKYIGNYVMKVIDKNIKRPATFEEIAEQSEGDDKIGVLRMDVDNLGTFFRDLNKDKSSITYYATISRLLDLFFSGYVGTNISDKESDPYYVVYAGGDDLFIVGAWDKLLKKSFEINKDFKEFVCNNEKLSLSAGYIACSHNLPVSSFAYYSDVAEKNAKENGKNCICVFSNIIRWDEADDVLKLAEKMIEKIKNKEISRGFIHYLNILSRQFLIDHNKSEELLTNYLKEPKLMIYPLLFYYINRNFSSKLKENGFVVEFINYILDKKNYDKLGFIINYSVYKTRERG
ncbi:type III-A CRISPR-associated protein Cas10/Csm1 [Deferribacter thermophilus]|uniref:type III-A CRISPR-associated protein Cas10/Csm1 n=1 Tax=Deferribacter thermophilus TaxID=53573 RepID=UPI003C1FA0B6